MLFLRTGTITMVRPANQYVHIVATVMTDKIRSAHGGDCSSLQLCY